MTSATGQSGAPDAWTPASGIPTRCSHARPARPQQGVAGLRDTPAAVAPGALDETARRLSHEELHVARVLAGEGHDVRSLPESRGRGRTADLEVCGSAVEVKSWLPLEERRGIAPTPISVVNKLISAEGQSAAVVLSAVGSGLTHEAASAGVARYATMRRSCSIAAVRVLGDGFDLSWERSPVAELLRPADRSVRQGISV